MVLDCIDSLYLPSFLLFFNKEGSFYLACNEKREFFTSEQPKDLTCRHVRTFVTLSIIFWATSL